MDSPKKPNDNQQRYYYDVFGITMRVDRRDGQWRLFRVSAEGKSSAVRDVFIPEDLREEELEIFLDDMFHEFASATNNKVSRLRK